MTTPTPTTKTITRPTGETFQSTEWTLGAYTLRKIEEVDYTDWTVRCTDRNLPRVEDVAGLSDAPEFGVSCSSVSDLAPVDANVWAGKIMEAADTAKAFNLIVDAN